MPGQACTGRSGPVNSRFHHLQTLRTRGPWSHLPLDCWYNILQFSEPPAIARFAMVSRECKTLAYDKELWKPHFKKTWSPESSGSLQTTSDGKDFRSLYKRWLTGQPAAVDLVPGVHTSDTHLSGVEAIQLSQAGAPAAWSGGSEGTLVGTDMTTCQILKRFLPESIDMDEPELLGVTVLDSIGLVCAGGMLMTGWDPRQPGNTSSAIPAFNVPYIGEEPDSMVHTMISAASPEGSGPPQLLTGGSEVYLWDLRSMKDGPVREYECTNTLDYWSVCGGVKTLLREPRHGTLLAGGMGGISRSDFNTGAFLSNMRLDSAGYVWSSAAGTDRLISIDCKNITEWALPDPHAIVRELKPNWVRPLANIDNDHARPVMIQGLGEDLQRVLAGTKCGSICTWERLDDPDELPICWSLGDHLPVEVTCLSATDQLVVLGLADGALRVVRLDSQAVEDAMDVM